MGRRNSNIAVGRRHHLSVGFILEEGFAIDDLRRLTKITPRPKLFSQAVIVSDPGFRGAAPLVSRRRQQAALHATLSPLQAPSSRQPPRAVGREDDRRSSALREVHPDREKGRDTPSV
jgi:hypothetical protein